jgi:hypothetical protein
MRLLTAPFDPSARAPSALARPLLEVALIAAGGIALSLAADTLAGEWRGLGRAAASGGGHAGIIAAGWVIALGGAPRWRIPAAASAAALIMASAAARLVPAGAVLYLLVPLVLARQAGRARLDTRWIGWTRPQTSRQVVVGVVAGSFLGLHLLIAASLTLGYTASVPSISAYLAGMAYDVGANALSVEWLFHGALFSALWRRWTFWPAAAVSTGAGLLRYLVDPALPTAPEAAAGAVFYLTLLGLSSCALRAWSGSLLPGYLATLAFFAAYRTLQG